MQSALPLTVRRSLLHSLPRRQAHCQSFTLPLTYRTQTHLSSLASSKMTNEHPFKPTWPAKLYANARPDYPRQVLDVILNAATAQTGNKPINYVDLAAGTGIFTRLLIQACTNDKGNTHSLASVVAVEPSQGMREELSDSLFAADATVPLLKKEGKLDENVQTAALEGKFDSIDLTSLNLQGKVDLITIAQAWHWCIDHDAALRAIADVLKPGGILAIVWNLEDREKARWVADLRDLYEKYEGNSRQYRHGTWRAMYDTEAIKLFDAVDEHHLRRALPTTVEGVCDRTASKSYVSMQPQEKQDEIKQEIRNMFDAKSDQELQRVWIDKSSGTFEYPYGTDVFLFRKK